MRSKSKHIGLVLVLCLSAATAIAQQQAEYYERETNQHLGSDSESYFTIHQLVRNGANHHDTSDLFTYRDSTFLERRSLDGMGLLERTLLRAEERKLFFDAEGEPKFDITESYVIDKKAEELLPEGFTYAKLDNPLWPCSFSYERDGVYLVHEDLKVMVRPVLEFIHIFPEYDFFASSASIETFEGFSGAEGWYYVNVAPRCMGNPTGICRQVVLPISMELINSGRSKLLKSIEIPKE